MGRARYQGLEALKDYHNRPEGPVVPVKTNWTPAAANDNINPEDIADMRVERRWACRPTIGEIAESMHDAVYREAPDADFHKEKGEHNTTRVPVAGDFECNEAGQIVRIGKLRFSDGSQTEKAYTYGPDGKLMQFDARMPVGAMLGTKDAQERMLGGDGVIVSNACYTATYKARLPGKAKRKAKVAPVPHTKAEMRDELAALPDHPVTHYPAGFPWKPSNLRDLFLGLEKAPKGEAGSIAWQDISGHIVEREVWAQTVAVLSTADKATLEATKTARTLADIDPGGSDRGARKRGRRALMAANDNLMAAIKKATK